MKLLEHGAPGAVGHGEKWLVQRDVRPRECSRATRFF